MGLLFSSPHISPDQEDDADQLQSVEPTKSTELARPIKRLVFIEGNISSGKSTLVRNLQNKGYMVFEEPLKSWINDYKDEEGTNALKLFYADKKKYGFQFQMMSLYTRWQVIKQALALLSNTSDDDGETNIVFVERSLLTDRNSFALNLHESGDLTALEWKIYNDCLECKLNDIKHLFEGIEVGYLYLRTSPSICLQRKIERNNPEEKDIPIEYFILLHEKYDHWLGKISREKDPSDNDDVEIVDDVDCLINISYHEVVDGNKTADEVLADVMQFCNQKIIEECTEAL